jgi:predicted nucleic-acid-binding protein
VPALDTNVLVRFLVGDDAHQSAAQLEGAELLRQMR